MHKGTELSVFQGRNPAGREKSNLRKQKSLTNLTRLSEGEHRVYSFDLDETEAPRETSRNFLKKDGRQRAGSLSRTLSRSEHSLFHGSPPAGAAAAQRASEADLCAVSSGSGKWSTSLGCQWAEVKAPNKVCEVTDEEGSGSSSSSRSDDDPALFCGSNVTGSQYWAEEEAGCQREGTAHLDHEVILTMLGDLEQALYTNILREDPETRRMRTVKNIADLRQNLEETMSSLRGTQISHSTLETTFDSTVTTEVNSRSIPSLTSRSSPMAWRLGQSSPRLQAGDAPSLPSGYPPRSNSSRFMHTDPSRFMYTTPLRRATGGARAGNLTHMDLSEKGGGDLDVPEEVDVTGYMSDGDLLSKNMRTDEISSGYLTDGGLNLYSRNMNHIPDLASSRDVIQRGVNEVMGDTDSWDDSSSVSSGLSDTLDNISTDDLNTASSVSSYSNIAASPRKSKGPQCSFILFRLFGTKASSKPSSTASPESKNSTVISNPHAMLTWQGSLESPSSGTGSMGTAGSQSGGSSPLFSKPPDLTTDVISLNQSLASSPASVHSLTSGGKQWSTNLSSSSAGSKDTLSYQSLTSLHTSSESIDFPVVHHGSLSGLTTSPKEVHGLLMRTGSVKSTVSEGYTPSTRQTSQEEGKEWLRSHSTGGLQDTGSQSPLASPSAISSSTAGKYHYSNLVSPTNLSQFNLPGPSMMRSNSIPAQESSFDLYGGLHVLGGSAVSLEEQPRGMSRSESFRDSMEEEGKTEALIRQTTGNQSAACRLFLTVKGPSPPIRSHLVAAFEKSLSNMTCRLHSLTTTAEQKESELVELRETIECLKTQNTDAQTAIQVALNGPDHLHKDLRIRRQHSSDSVSSMNSATSLSSVGSTNDAEAKKKKKKSWLRSSFKQAFGKKKSTKPPSPHSDIEELTDSSLPSSPKLPHSSKQGGIPSMKTSQSASELCECTEAEAEIILQLKNELREKELKLTDIRLEALSSAHHLDQIREAMNRMQNEIELLKAENDRLKLSGSPTPAATRAKTGRPPSETSSTSSSSSSRQSLGLSLNNLNVTDTIMSDVLLDDGYEGTMCKEGRSVRIVVTIHRGSNSTKQDVKCQEYLIGSIGVSGKTKWDVLDGVIRRLFKEYIFRVDPLTTLGLNSDSIVSYRIGDIVRAHNVEIPELLPCGYLVGVNNVIAVNLKGVKENSIDSLVFDTLIPKTISQRYLNLLMEHRRIILSGPSGTGKTFLANKLAEYVVCKSGRENREGNIASFNVDHKSSKELRQYLSNLADQCNSEGNEADLPVVVILDNLHHIGSLSDIFNGFLNCKYHKCPYVIGTMNQAVSSSPNLELHHNFRWVLCANHTEPVKGFLGRYLRRKLIETEIDKNMRNNDLIKIIDWIPKTWQHLNSFLEAHSSSDVTIGPRLFLSCPMDADSCRVWFTDLWNYSLVPYLLEAVREGLQLYGKRAAWEDPSKWVIDTYPWSSASLQHDWQSLLQLRPEDVGYEGYTSAKEGGSSKQVSQSDTEGDPLMNMLMRLQEAANYSSAQSCDSDSTGHHDDLLDSSLESTL
ncbi:UNVERIFIED_CONTAM: hypothetical protein FKN15_075959 [Acipenser sinensis]